MIPQRVENPPKYFFWGGGGIWIISNLKCGVFLSCHVHKLRQADRHLIRLNGLLRPLYSIKWITFQTFSFAGRLVLGVQGCASASGFCIFIFMDNYWMLQNGYFKKQKKNVHCVFQKTHRYVRRLPCQWIIAFFTKKKICVTWNTTHSACVFEFLWSSLITTAAAVFRAIYFKWHYKYDRSLSKFLLNYI